MLQDETLTNILNLLQNNNESTTKNNTNNDLQNLLIKMLLSGSLNNFFTPKPQEPTPAVPRTINLENYRRLD